MALTRVTNRGTDFSSGDHNIGIGTDNPTSLLHVTGNVSVGGTLTYEDVTNVDSVGLATFQNGIRVTDGSVGIGTTNPKNRLHVYDGSSGNISYNIGDGIIAESNSNVSLLLQTPNDKFGAIQWGDTDNHFRARIQYDHPTDAMLFKTNGNNEKVRITNNGRVGIGTTTPTAKLDVDGTVNVTGVITARSAIHVTGISSDQGVIKVQTTGVPASAPPATLELKSPQNGQIDFSPHNSNEISGRIRYVHTDNGTNDSMQFSIKESGGDRTEKLRITNTGRVGIGTGTPDQLLHLKSSTDTTILIESDDANLTSNERQWEISQSASGGQGDGALIIGGSNSNNVLAPAISLYRRTNSNQVDQIRFRTRADDALTIRHDGDIGIGTTIPSHKLDVVGDTQLYGTLVIGDNTDISPTANGAGQLHIDANGYTPYIAADGTAMYVGHNSSSRDLILQTNETDRLTIDGSSGSIGIGTDDPTEKLSVGGADSYLGNHGIGVHKPHSIGLKNGVFVYTDAGYNGSSSYRAAAFKAVGTSGHALGISTDAGSDALGGTQNAYINFDGSAYFASDVGIGTNNPTSDLHVFKSTAASSIIDAAAGDALLTLRNAGNTNWSGINFTRERSTGTDVTGGSIWMPSDTSNNSATLYLQTQSASAGAGAAGALTDNNGVRVKLASQPGGSGPNSAFTVEVGSAERFRVTSAGNVGIGTDNPLSTLEVGGTIHQTGNVQQPNIKPVVDFNFAATKVLDHRITFARNAQGTYHNELGFIEYASNNTPRFDHDPTTGESLGLLVEEERTNRYSKFNNSTSQLTGVNSTYIDINTNAGVNPDRSNAVAYTATKTNNANQFHGFPSESITVSSDTTITWSMWLREFNNSDYRVLFVLNARNPSTNNSNYLLRTFRPSTGEWISGASVGSVWSNASATITEYPNGWYRVSLTGTYTFESGRTLVEPGFQLLDETNDQTYDPPTANTHGVYVWGPQAELDSFATSYIPNDGSGTVSTRVQDAVTITGTNFTDLFNTQFHEFSMFVDYDNLDTFDGNTFGIIDFWGESSNFDNRLQFFKDNSSPYHIETRAFAGGAALFGNGNLSASSKSAAQRVAFSWYVPDYSTSTGRRWAYSFSGEDVDVVGPISSSGPPLLTRLGIGINPTRLDTSAGRTHFKRVTIFNKALPDAQLKGLTMP